MKLYPSGARVALLLGLTALGALSAPTGVAPQAVAAPAAVFTAGPLIELLRPSDVTGDGATPIDLYVLALYADGSAIPAMAPKLTVTGGTADVLTDLGGGLYRLRFTPARTDAPTTATVAIKGKLPNKAAVERSWSFPVSVPRTRGLAVTANPAQLTLGMDKTASVAFTFRGGDPRALAGVTLALNSTVGTVTNVTNVGGGVFNGLYTVPAVATPQLALITAADAGDPMRTYGGLALPLTANVTQSVTGAPNTAVVLKIGGREFGPVKTDSKGRARIPVVLPPGTTTATRVEAGANGSVTETPFDLKLPESRRIALFPTAASLPSDAKVHVPVRAMVVTPDGKPDEMARVVFTASAGTVGPATHEGGGIYVATYTPPDGNAAVKATLGARLDGASAVQADSRALPLVPVRAAGIALTATPATLPAGATALHVSALVSGPAGTPLPGRTLDWDANGARLQGVVDGKNGSYDATFTPTGKGPVEITAAASAPATGNALAQLLVIPSRRRLEPDGLSSVMLTIATLDEFGYPVPNVPLTLALSTGDGSVPTDATTNASGVAQVYYTAGRANGLTAIDVTTGALAAGVSILQAPPELTAPELPTVASEAIRATVDAYARGLAAIRVERQ